MSSADVLSAVRRSLESIADSLDGVRFVIPGPERDGREASRRAVIDTIRQYLLQRLREPDAPVVAALVGLSGVGKSTLLNSLAQDTVSPSGVVRPTTTHGVLWAHRDHAARYWTEFVGRVRRQIGPTTDVVIGSDPLTRHLTFVDTPPLEVTPAETATTAVETLMFADICVFVTSASRYADAAPLGLLDTARDRGIPILFVLNRLPVDPDERRQLLVDFADKLVDAGFLREPDPDFIFGVEEASSLRWHGGLAPNAVASLRKELSEVSDPEFRIIVIDETAEATVQAIADRAESLAVMLQAEGDDRRRLKLRAREIYAEAEAHLRADLAAETFSALSGHEVWSQASIDLSGLVTRAAGIAAGKVAREWLAHPDGPGLLDPGHEGLRRHGPLTADAARSELDDWMQGLPDLVAAGRQRRPRKRKTKRLVDHLWRVALDRSFETRRRKEPGAGTVSRARDALGDAMARSLQFDAERFSRRLGADVDEDAPATILAASAYLRELPDDREFETQSGGARRDG